MPFSFFKRPFSDRPSAAEVFFGLIREHRGGVRASFLEQTKFRSLVVDLRTSGASGVGTPKWLAVLWFFFCGLGKTGNSVFWVG